MRTSGTSKKDTPTQVVPCVPMIYDMHIVRSAIQGLRVPRTGGLLITVRATVHYMAYCTTRQPTTNTHYYCYAWRTGGLVLVLDSDLLHLYIVQYRLVPRTLLDSLQ